MRMADADLLPFDFRSLYKTVSGYVKDLMDKTEQLRETTATENLVIGSNSYALANDPTDHLKIPTPKSEVPYLNFSPLQNAVTELEKSSGRVAEAWSKTVASGTDHGATDQSLSGGTRIAGRIGLPAGRGANIQYMHRFYTAGCKVIPGTRPLNNATGKKRRNRL